MKKALVVGGGIGGMSAAIALRRIGWEVDLVDRDPEWRVYGAGITLTGPTLRAFHGLGIYDRIVEQGYTGDGIAICGVDGVRVRVVATPASDVPGLGSSGGIMRPVLHQVLSERTRASGTTVRLGVSAERLEPDGTVLFTDGRAERYALVIGADGVHSRMRDLLFPGAPRPAYTGQCAWRLVVPRETEIDRRHFFLGGPLKVGLSPVSAREMYMFLLEKRERPVRFADADLSRELHRLLEGYGGILAGIRAGLDASSRIVVRPLEGFLLPPPWTTSNAVLIGDAAHPTTPQLASGAGMAVEDALVLAAELDGEGSVEAALARFMERRYERCRLVVESSLEIGKREQAGAPAEEQTAVLESALRVLAAPF